MYCGICVEVCPFDALFWSPEYEYSEPRIADLLHDKDLQGNDLVVQGTRREEGVGLIEAPPQCSCAPCLSDDIPTAHQAVSPRSNILRAV